jgi:ABC-2 type transport system permease protein
MLRYFRIFFDLIKFNLIQEMEFRRNFYIRLITQLFFVVLQLIIVGTFFRYTQSLGSWSQNEVFVLVGIFRLIEGLFHMFIFNNLLYLPDFVNEGELDLILTKPLNNLFLVSLKRHQLYEISTFASGIIILIYTDLVRGSMWWNIMFQSVLGFIALYSIVLFFSTISFYVPRLTALSSLWDLISKTDRFPLDIFTGSSRIVFWLLAPMFLVVTLPSQLVLGKVPPYFIFIQLSGVCILFSFVYLFWLFSLRHYSSASS